MTHAPASALLTRLASPRRSVLSAICASALLAACALNPPGSPVARVDPPTMADAAPRDYAGLHNVVAYHDGYYSGSVPQGQAGFDTLRAMGVRTIISVDGAAPDVPEAESRGIRYIHLPIGYNGFDEQRKLELVRATRDAMKTGPVYIHCHHGKHRSAGAAAVVVASLGWSTPDEAIDRMKVSGTAPNYKGLYACTAEAVVLDPAAINAVPADFPQIARTTGFVKAMVEIDEINERLKLIEKAGWTVPADHPDLVPAAEAGRMADLLRVSAETDRARSGPAEFTSMLRTNSEQATALEDMLAAGEQDTAKLSARFRLVAATCRDCHARHRD